MKEEQFEALQLADAMSLAFPGNRGIDKVAAMIRQLVIQNEVLHERHHGLNEEYKRVIAQRDQLLEALSAVISADGCVQGGVLRAIRNASTVVESVKGSL